MPTPTLAPDIPGFSFANITTQTTTLVKTGAGFLDKIILNTPLVLAVITIYDNIAGSGNKIGTITLPAALLNGVVSIPYGLRFNLGLTIVTAGANADITVVYQ